MNKAVLMMHARAIRLAVIQRMYDEGELSEEEAAEILSGRLDPDDPESVVDDASQLVVKHGKTAV